MAIIPMHDDAFMLQNKGASSFTSEPPKDLAHLSLKALKKRRDEVLATYHLAMDEEKEMYGNCRKFQFQFAQQILVNAQDLAKAIRQKERF